MAAAVTNPLASLWEGTAGAVDNGFRDLKRFSEDITGKTARSEADKAARFQEEAQRGMEKRIYDKKNLDEASDDMAKKRAAQKALQMKQGGRASTILTGGFDSGAEGIDGGKKVLLGQ